VEHGNQLITTKMGHTVLKRLSQELKDLELDIKT